MRELPFRFALVDSIFLKRLDNKQSLCLYPKPPQIILTKDLLAQAQNLERENRSQWREL